MFDNAQTHNQYYLDKLQEEAAEIIQAISKVRRFGPDNSHPDRQQTNMQELVGEIEDLLALIACLEANQVLDLTLSRANITQKFKSIYKMPQSLANT